MSLRGETLHHFWRLGVLHPIAVLEAALPGGHDPERFVEAELGLGERSFIDLGADVAADASFAPPTLTLSPAVGRAVLWHPFQLWIFSRVHDLLRLPLATEAVLRGPEVYASLAADHVTRVPRLLTSFAQDPAHHEYLRVLALLLLVEPLVRPWLNLPIREGHDGAATRPSRTTTPGAVLRMARACLIAWACRSRGLNIGTASWPSRRRWPILWRRSAR